LPSRRAAVVRYAAAWLVAGALGVILAVAIGGPAQDTVELPPIQQPDLETAVRTAGCQLRGDGSAGAGGTRGAPALAPGVYDAPAEPAQLTATRRRGLVVIVYRPTLPEPQIDRLRALYRAVPAGTVIAPLPRTTRYAVSALSARRVLGCRRFSAATIDAVRLFRGRYLGRRAGP